MLIVLHLGLLLHKEEGRVFSEICKPMQNEKSWSFSSIEHIIPTHPWGTTSFSPNSPVNTSHIVIMGRALILGSIVLLAMLAQPIMVPAQPISVRAELLRSIPREISNTLQARKDDPESALPKLPPKGPVPLRPAPPPPTRPPTQGN
jgi:hypothetical protein